eukprot:snap_masked-scaffold_16-processed-gene-6.95-mRNA-1 protein AED:0.33 eAED:0.33 QI:0/-1/0/1/-1/1/1/0/190
MGIDLRAGGRKTKHKNRKAPRSKNNYLLLLVKLYRFLARRAESDFNTKVLKRLFMSRTNMQPLSLKKVINKVNSTEGTSEKTIPCLVATITNDLTLLPSELEQLKGREICALRFTEEARKRIEKYGGTCLTFDQLAMKAPKGQNCLLLRGDKKARKAERYFGKDPGSKGSHTRPRVRSKGRKFERARLRR